ncbi:MAG: hypothetical protein OXC07_05025 [Kistimonas sp.]|nr:hypothetical protein [Kistimonas sp.]
MTNTNVWIMPGIRQSLMDSLSGCRRIFSLWSGTSLPLSRVIFCVINLPAWMASYDT